VNDERRLELCKPFSVLGPALGEIDGAFRSWGFSKGGTGQVSLSIARAAQHFGAEIRTGVGVERVRLDNGRATGVVLSNGDELDARTVISGVDPHRTFLGLVGEDHLPEEFTAQIRRYKLRGSSGKVNLALDGVPEFTCRPGDGPHLRGDIAIAPSVDYLERAYDDAQGITARFNLNVLARINRDLGGHFLALF
jgi:phytoene dehydrogenase-like protein